MTTQDERMRILNMLQEGKINAQEASDLLSACDDSSEKSTDIPSSNNNSPRKARFFIVKVTDLSTGKQKVNVRIPMGLIKLGMKLGGKLHINVNEKKFNLDEINTEALFNEAPVGPLVDVTDEEDMEHIQIDLE